MQTADRPHLHIPAAAFHHQPRTDITIQHHHTTNPLLHIFPALHLTNYHTSITRPKNTARQHHAPSQQTRTPQTPQPQHPTLHREAHHPPSSNPPGVVTRVTATTCCNHDTTPRHTSSHPHLRSRAIGRRRQPAPRNGLRRTPTADLPGRKRESEISRCSGMRRGGWWVLGLLQGSWMRWRHFPFFNSAFAFVFAFALLSEVQYLGVFWDVFYDHELYDSSCFLTIYAHD